MKYATALFLSVLAAHSTLGVSQQIAYSALPTEFSSNASRDSDSSITVVVGHQASPAASKPFVDRWLDLKTLSYSARYRSTTNWHGRHLFEFGQDRYLADGRVKLDAGGRYTVNFHASSGRYFNWSYADLIGGQYQDSVVAARAFKTPAESAALKAAVALDPNGATYSAGIPSRGGYFAPRQLFFSATPIDQVTVEFGSLAIEHGQNSEVTSYDEDGYMSGERVRIHDSKHLFFDQVAFTNGYVGSPLTPNFFSRGNDLGKSNYQQYLVDKKIGKYAVVSVDFTATNSTQTMREAVNLKTPGAHVIDSTRVELYQRPGDVKIATTNFAGGYGYAVSARKLIAKRLDFEGGYADVDERYSVYGGSIYLATVGFAWNADSFETGKRGYTKTELKIAPGLTAFGFYTHTLVAPTIGHNLQGLNAGINIDAKAIVNSTRRIF